MSDIANNIVEMLEPPRGYSGGNLTIQRGMRELERIVQARADELSISVIITKGIEGRLPQHGRPGMDMWCFFALEAARKRGKPPQHKYMSGRFSEYKVGRDDKETDGTNAFIIGAPVSIFGEHKQIIAFLNQHIGDVEQKGGGFYELNPLRVYGESGELGAFKHPDGVQAMLQKLCFHYESDRDQDSLQMEERQVRKLMGLPEEEQNAEIERRLLSSLRFLAGESDDIPFDYCYGQPSPSLSLAEFGRYGECYNFVNMPHYLALNIGNCDEPSKEVTVKFTGAISSELARLLVKVAEIDFEGQAEKGSPVYMARSVGILHRMRLLPPPVEELALQHLPLAFENLFNKGARGPDATFNDRAFFAELEGTAMYTEAVKIAVRKVDETRGRYSPTANQNEWYVGFMKKVNKT